VVGDTDAIAGDGSTVPGDDDPYGEELTQGACRRVWF
jgi:hypothetical protein